MAVDSTGRGAGPQGRANPGQDRNASSPGGARDGQGGRGGGAFGGSRLAGPQGRANPMQRRDATTPGGASRGQGGAGGGTFQGVGPQGRANPIQSGSALAGATADYNDEGNSALDNLGNLIAGFLGFNEQNPAEDGYDASGSAGWGFDPAGLIGGAVGSALGVPLVGGFVADQISSALGRPLEVNLGPSVFGGLDGETTVSGPTMTARDPNDQSTFFGAPPQLAGFGNGVANVASGKSTFTGSDPAAPAPTPEPPAPEPELPDIDGPMTPPNGVNIDPGNTGIPAGDLASLFQRLGNRVYKGKNHSAVVT
jgi:hypothetical protein